MKFSVTRKVIPECRTVDLDKFDSFSLIDVISKVIYLNTKLSNFWGKGVDGWSPDEVTELFSETRMERVVSFSHRLEDALRDVSQSEEEAHLISSWVTLGALIESSLALFFTIYRNDYVKNGPRKKDGKITEPTKLSFHELKSVMLQHGLIDQKSHDWVENVQQFRNVIHIFRDKNIGTRDDLVKSIKRYLALLEFINHSLPYPDEMYSPRI